MKPHPNLSKTSQPSYGNEMARMSFILTSKNFAFILMKSQKSDDNRPSSKKNPQPTRSPLPLA